MTCRLQGFLVMAHVQHGIQHGNEAVSGFRVVQDSWILLASANRSRYITTAARGLDLDLVNHEHKISSQGRRTIKSGISLQPFSECGIVP